MGVFQASMLESMQSLRDEFKTMLKPPEVGVDQTPTLISKPGTSKQNILPSSHPSSNPNIRASMQPDEPM